MRKYRTTETFIEDAEKIHGDKYTYDKAVFTQTKNKVTVTCAKHGDFQIQAGNLLHGKGCMQCAIDKRADIRRDTLEDFIRKSEVTHGSRYDYSQVAYVRETDPVIVICKEHGPFTVLPELHKKVQGCPVCAKAVKVEKLSDTSQTFIEKAIIVHGTLYDYSEVDYKGTKEYVRIKCREHGVFEQWPNNHIDGKGCPKCQPGGFNKDIPGHLYILVHENVTKVGITNKPPENRCKVVSQSSKKDFDVVVSYAFDGVKTRLIEKQVIEWLRENFKQQKEIFNGYTECFVDVNLAALIDKIEQLK